MTLKEKVFLLFAGAALLVAAGLGPVLNADDEPDVIDSYYSERPSAWWDEVSAGKYFDISKTNTWVRNETCSDAGAISVATMNIWQDVAFITDYSDDREDDIGQVMKCADVVLLQEAWDYDDLKEDGTDADMKRRGFNYIRRGDGGSHYCDNTFGIEDDCTGLYLYSKHPVVKNLGVEQFDGMAFPDSLKGKGVVGFIVRKENKYYYVYNTHFHYGSKGHKEGNSSDDSVREKNWKETRDFVVRTVNANKGTYRPAAIIVAGDFNSDFSFAKTSSGTPAKNSKQIDVSSHFEDMRTYWANRGGSGWSFGKYEYHKTGGWFWTNWPGGGDNGPNKFATGNRSHYDAAIVGKPGVFGGCGIQSVEFSGWAPQWKSKSGRRIQPSYSWSDHYGVWIKVRPSC